MVVELFAHTVGVVKNDPFLPNYSGPIRVKIIFQADGRLNDILLNKDVQCTTRCTQLPPSFPTIPQQCHEVLF